jgi:manganese/zinc/iron transport system permease protein
MNEMIAVMARLEVPWFDVEEVLIAPWTRYADATVWMVLMAVLLGVPCALLGNYLMLRRMALAGDAISHSVLPGLVISYLIFRDLGTLPMMGGAMVAGLVTTVLIEFITGRSRLKTDAAMGITYTTLFALGMFLVNRYAGRVHLDADCVLFGELEYVPLAEPSGLRAGGLGPVPMPVVVAAAMAVGTLGMLAVFSRWLLVTSFDGGFARSVGIRAGAVHYGLMAVLSVVVVTALESVGLLVAALLVLPGATAQFFARRMGRLHGLAAVFAVTASLVGIHLGAWLNCPSAAAIALAGGVQFGVAWGVSVWLRGRGVEGGVGGAG